MPRLGRKKKGKKGAAAAAAGDDNSALYQRQREFADYGALSPGQRRFAMHDERGLAEQLDDLTADERAAFEELKERWGAKPRAHDYSDEMFLKFIRCSPGERKFNVKTAYPVVKKYTPWALEQGYHRLPVGRVEAQLRTKTLVALPKLRSADGHEFLYMKPARFFPGKTDTADLIASLVYLLDHMTDHEDGMTQGIAFMANMEDWGYSNFSVSYCRQFFETMQGRFPVRVRTFLIINPPSWFGSIWRIIKSMISKEFAEKVHMPDYEGMKAFLHDDCSLADLPDEFGGELDVDEAIEDFIEYRRLAEGAGGDSDNDGSSDGESDD